MFFFFFFFFFFVFFSFFLRNSSTFYSECLTFIFQRPCQSGIYANSADPDQTAPFSCLIRVCTICHSSKSFVLKNNFKIKVGIKLCEFLGYLP